MPDDEQVIKAANQGEPTVLRPDSRASIAYRNIARRILGEPVPLMNLQEETGFFHKMRRLIGLG